MMKKIDYKYRIRTVDPYSYKDVDLSEGTPKSFRVIVESYMLFNGWKKIQTFYGSDHAKMLDDAGAFIEKCKAGEHWLHDQTYRLMDAIVCKWRDFKWRWLDFGYVGKLHKYDCEYFLPLKKVWHFGYPKVHLREATEKITTWLKFGWLNRLLIKKFNRYLSLETPLVSSPLAPLGRVNINPIFALYIFPLGWKDKYNTPRYEQPPQVSVWLFRIFNIGFQLFPDFENYAKDMPKDEYWHNVDSYWEQSLWVSEYNGGDVVKARNEWPWRTIPMNEGEAESTTWDDRYLI